MSFFQEADKIPEGKPFDHATGKITGLILARGGSKGVPLKNIKTLAGKPLLEWSLTAMRDSGVFDKNRCDLFGAMHITMCATVHPFHFKEAVAMYREHKCDSVFSVKRQKSFRWNFQSDGLATPANFKLPEKIDKTKWEGELYENGTIYMTHRSNIKKGELQFGKCMYYEMAQQYNTDIDTEFDFVVAENIVKKYGYKRPNEKHISHGAT